MGRTRLEAFSDGVIAIIITIMVLEMHAPHGADLDSLRPVRVLHLEVTLMRHPGPESALRAAVGHDVKGMISLVMYALAIAASFGNRWIAMAIYVAVALMWLIPDPRIERRTNHA